MAETAPKRNPPRRQPAAAAASAAPGAGDTWRLKDAKARFSELFERALERPQRVTRHGKRAVVVLAEEEYRRLRDRGTERKNLAQFLAELPLAELDLRREDIDIFPRDLDL